MLRVGDESWEAPITDANEAHFEVELPVGPTTLETTISAANASAKGAYQVIVELVASTSDNDDH